MKRDDRVRLQHMLDAATEAQTFASGRTRADLDSNRMLSLALIRSIEVIGEAAAQVSAETRAANPGIPWPSIVAMRNRLIHAYFDVDLDRVWETVTDDLPPLVRELRQILVEE
jgi:uncharacterized protein with HEPN domain